MCHICLLINICVMLFLSLFSFLQYSPNMTMSVWFSFFHFTFCFFILFLFYLSLPFVSHPSLCCILAHSSLPLNPPRRPPTTTFSRTAGDAPWPPGIAGSSDSSPGRATWLPSATLPTLQLPVQPHALRAHGACQSSRNPSQQTSQSETKAGGLFSDSFFFCCWFLLLNLKIFHRPAIGLAGQKHLIC